MMSRIELLMMIILLFLLVLLGIKHSEARYIEGINDGQSLIIDKYRRIKNLSISYDSSHVLYEKEIDLLIDGNIFFNAKRGKRIYK